MKVFLVSTVIDKILELELDRIPLVGESIMCASPAEENYYFGRIVSVMTVCSTNKHLPVSIEIKCSFDEISELEYVSNIKSLKQ